MSKHIKKITCYKTNQFNTYWQKLRASCSYHPANRFRYYLINKLVAAYIKQPKSIIDIGCGNGELLIKLKQLFPKANLTGVDISEDQIKINSCNMQSMSFINMNFSRGNILKYINRKYDLVISSEVIEHVIDDEKFLKNAVNVLSRNGILLLTTQSGRRYQMDRKILGHLRHYDLRYLCKMLTNNGLTIIRAYTCGFPVLSMQKYFVEMFFNIIVQQVASHNKPNLFIRGLMKIMYIGLCFSPFKYGPQLVIVAKKK